MREEVRRKKEPLAHENLKPDSIIAWGSLMPGTPPREDSVSIRETVGQRVGDAGYY